MFIADVYSEQSQRGSQYATSEPTACIRPVAGTDCYEDCRSTGGFGEFPSLLGWQ